MELKIEYLKVENITPYKKNAKIHTQKQIEQIKTSIKKFGMNDPIGIWGKKNTVVEGHGRLIACKELGYKEVPIIRLDELTNSQRKAYNLAHNKLTMNTDFDVDLLNSELKSITDIDMSEFDFQLIDQEDTVLDFDYQEKENERERTFKAYNLEYNDIARTAGKYHMPIIKKQLMETPKMSPIGFNYVLNTTQRGRGVHCYLDDYQIERLWNSPQLYMEKLAEFPYVFTPDYSLYIDMPIAMQIWNTYRNRLVGQIMQDYGVTTIPTISWGLPETFEFCFDGIEQGSIVSVSTIGVKRNEYQTEVWRKGMDEMIKRIKPSAVWCYGGEVEYDYKGVSVTYFENEVTEKLKNIRKEANE